MPFLCTLTCLAGADTIYNVSGTFKPTGPSNPSTGPLNGGSFSGTFSAILPLPSGGESIFSFNINLFDSSGAVRANLSSDAGGIGGASVESNSCSIASSTTGPCDRFIWSSKDTNNVLQLIAVPGFTGGATYPGFFSGLFDSLALLGGTGTDKSSFVASGAITPIPEPASLVLLGSAAALLFALAPRRRNKRHPRIQHPSEP